MTPPPPPPPSSSILSHSSFLTSTENPYLVAQRFIEENMLNQNYLQVRFIFAYYSYYLLLLTLFPSPLFLFRVIPSFIPSFPSPSFIQEIAQFIETNAGSAVGRGDAVPHPRQSFASPPAPSSSSTSATSTSSSSFSPPPRSNSSFFPVSTPVFYDTGKIGAVHEKLKEFNDELAVTLLSSHFSFSFLSFLFPHFLCLRVTRRSLFVLLNLVIYLISFPLSLVLPLFFPSLPLALALARAFSLLSPLSIYLSICLSVCPRSPLSLPPPPHPSFLSLMIGTSFYHASTIKKEQFTLLEKLLSWPPSKLFPGTFPLSSFASTSSLPRSHFYFFLPLFSIPS